MNSRTRRTKFKPYPAVPELAAPTFTVPPAGKCPTLSREPTLAWAFSLKFSFWFSILTSPPPGTRLRRAEFINASRRVPLQIRLQTGETQVGNFHPCGHTGLQGKALEVPSGGDSHTPYKLPTVCLCSRCPLLLHHQQLHGCLLWQLPPRHTDPCATACLRSGDGSASREKPSSGNGERPRVQENLKVSKTTSKISLGLVLQFPSIN